MSDLVLKKSEKKSQLNTQITPVRNFLLNEFDRDMNLIERRPKQEIRAFFYSLKHFSLGCTDFKHSIRQEFNFSAIKLPA